MPEISLDIDAAQEAAFQQFNDNWTATPLGQVVFENEGEDDIDNQAAEWVRVSVRELGGGRENIAPKGSRKYRRAASVFVQCFVPVDAGARRAKQLAEAARLIFEGESLASGLDFNDGEVRDLGPDDKWQQAVMEAAFLFTKVK